MREEDCPHQEETHVEQRIDCWLSLFFPLNTSVPEANAEWLVGQIYVVFKSTRNVWILSPKALEELVHLRFKHTHADTSNSWMSHTHFSSAARLCWWWTKWSLALYMDRTSSHWSQPLAFYWIYQVSPYKCWLIYYRHCLSMHRNLLQCHSKRWLLSSPTFPHNTFCFPSACLRPSILSCCSLWTHFLRFCPKGDPSGIHHHDLCGIKLNLKLFTPRAINKKLYWQAHQWQMARMLESHL